MEIALLLLLLLLGVLFLILEIFLLPGFGIGGIAGLGFIISSIWYAFVKIGVVAGWITCVVSVVLIVFGIWLFLRMKILEKISLTAKIDGVANEPILTLNVGDIGVARTRLAPMGTAQFGEEEVEVRSEDGFVDPGTSIIISEKTTYHVLVRRH